MLESIKISFQTSFTEIPSINVFIYYYYFFFFWGGGGVAFFSKPVGGNGQSLRVSL